MDTRPSGKQGYLRYIRVISCRQPPTTYRSGRLWRSANYQPISFSLSFLSIHDTKELTPNTL
jgi:hypothetical protein